MSHPTIILAATQENLFSGFPPRSDTKRAVRQQKIDRGLKFWIKEEDGLYYLCSENKVADQLRRTLLLLRSSSVPLFSHMQNADFLITRLISHQ